MVLKKPPAFSSMIIISGNILTIVIALMFGYALASIVWLYWAESLMIGFYTVLRMMLTGFRKKKLALATGLSGFFCVHYGFFHLGYLVFLLVMPWFTITYEQAVYILPSVFVLFLSHATSFYVNVFARMEGAPMANLGAIFEIPYTRIIPMHLTIIASGFIIAITDTLYSLPLLMIFMGLKTVADVKFHDMEHQSLKIRGNVGKRKP